VSDRAAPATRPSRDQTAELLLDIVAKKAGLDRSMLDLDMDLNDDLALDSVTRIEIVAAVRDAVPMLPDASEQELARVRTLREVLAFF
jgi:acyl carrier protein